MFIINCLPFSKGLKLDTLSYFSSEFISPGSLVYVTLRNKKTVALVISVNNVREVKSMIKSADFKMKKISSFISKPFLGEDFMKAVQKTSDYFLTTEGALLSSLIPKVAIKNSKIISDGQNKNRNIKNLKNKNVFGVFCTQSESEERISNYRSLIREEFAKSKSVFFCISQNEQVLELKSKLERGIEAYVVTFYRNMTEKEFKEEWQKLKNTNHPLVIIATPKWLFIERDDVEIFIIENENSNGWKTISKPFFDFRYFAEALVKEKNMKIIFGDSFLRIETLNRYESGQIQKFENVKWRLGDNLEIEKIDLKTKNKKEGPFRAVSEKIIDIIKENIRAKNHTFIFASRKGFAPVVICRDCGEEVKCSNCSSLMVLYKTKTGSILRCHQCDETRSAEEYCKNCGGWRLAAFGSGMERIVSEIKKEIEEVRVYEISKDKATTKMRAINIIKNFYNDGGGVLVGTEMAFSYLSKKVTTTIVASFESLFAIPDFKIKEKIFKIILETKNLAKRQFVIQSRNLEDPAIDSALSGNLKEFYENEINDRKILNYPPFGIFIKITVRGTKKFVSKEIEKLNKKIEQYNPSIFNSIHEKNGAETATNVVIKIPKEEWPEQDLLKILKNEAPHFEIKVDPENLL